MKVMARCGVLRAVPMLAALFVAALFVSACGPKGNQPNVELIQDMMEQPAVKAQAFDDFSTNGISSRVPPSNSVPVGFVPYKYERDPEAAGRELQNPFAGKMDDSILLEGQKYYQTNCTVCHGAGGLGDGPIKPVFPMPIPSLTSDKVRDRKSVV